MKSRIQEENTASDDVSVKEERTMPHDDSEDNKMNEHWNPSPEPSSNPESESKVHLNYDCFNSSDGVVVAASLFPTDFKDGASDSDSSAILNEGNSPKATVSSSGVLQSHQLLLSQESSSCFQFQKTYQTQYVKMEEHNFFSADEACNFFSDDQAPTLHWYCSEQWS